MNVFKNRHESKVACDGIRHWHMNVAEQTGKRLEFRRHFTAKCQCNGNIRPNEQSKTAWDAKTPETFDDFLSTLKKGRSYNLANQRLAHNLQATAAKCHLKI